jgi:hypothetical protein
MQGLVFSIYNWGKESETEMMLMLLLRGGLRGLR